MSTAPTEDEVMRKERPSRANAERDRMEKAYTAYLKREWPGIRHGSVGWHQLKLAFEAGWKRSV